MRMDPTADLTAAEIVNRYPESELGKIFREFGEERHWKRLAHTICEARRQKPIKTTTELASLITKTLGFGGKKKLHPATLAFQALRIAVNKELESIQEGILKAINFLATGGRIGVLSFHSGEDRIVKNLFRTAAHKAKARGPSPLLKLLTKKPLVPTFAEIRANPRSRSAKLRFAEKL